VTSGLALAGLLAGLAHPIGQLFGRPEVVPFLLGYTPLFLLVTAAVVPTARLQREGKFKGMAAIDITRLPSSAWALLSTVALRAGVPGPWSLNSS
jgi:hypothetical protein